MARICVHCGKPVTAGRGARSGKLVYVRGTRSTFEPVGAIHYACLEELQPNNGVGK